MINWHVRFKNKTWLLTFLPVAVSAVYNILALFEVVPAVTQDTVMQWLTTIVNMLAVLGIINDPTTAGLCDSVRALGYDMPYCAKAAAKRKVSK